MRRKNAHQCMQLSWQFGYAWTGMLRDVAGSKKEDGIWIKNKVYTDSSERICQCAGVYLCVYAYGNIYIFTSVNMRSVQVSWNQGMRSRGITTSVLHDVPSTRMDTRCGWLVRPGGNGAGAERPGRTTGTHTVGGPGGDGGCGWQPTRRHPHVACSVLGRVTTCGLG